MGGIQSLAAGEGIFANLNSASEKIGRAIEHLSTGKRINRASEDAAGLAVSEKLTTDIRGLKVAGRNASDAGSMMQVAEAAMSEITDMLQRRRELTLQVINGTLSAKDKINVDLEYSMLSEDILRVVDGTEFSGKNLLDGTTPTVSFQIGSNAGETLEVTLPDLKNTPGFLLGVVSLGNDSGSGTGELGTYPDSVREVALGHIDNSLDFLNNARASMGAGMNRLDSIERQISMSADTYSAARGRILDADMAVEAASLAKSQIQKQAAMAVSQQANSAASQVLSLIG